MKLAIEETLANENITNAEVIAYQELTVEIAEKYHANFFNSRTQKRYRLRL